MRGLVRLLMMFGPMIFRQFQKYQRNKARQLPRHSHDRQTHRDSQYGRQQSERQQSNRQQHNERKQHNERYAEYEDLNPEIGIKKEVEISPEERDFKLKEEDIMLDEEDLRYLKEDKKIDVPIEVTSEEVVEDVVEDVVEEIPAPKKDASDIDLEDLQDLFGKD